jgi:hypothetical protein
VDDKRTAEVWTFERNLKSRDPELDPDPRRRRRGVIFPLRPTRRAVATAGALLLFCMRDVDRSPAPRQAFVIWAAGLGRPTITPRRWRRSGRHAPDRARRTCRLSAPAPSRLGASTIPPPGDF